MAEPALPLPEPSRPRPSLISRIPAGGTADPDEILDPLPRLGGGARASSSIRPRRRRSSRSWPGKHVILNTPTGSGKSLVALGLHFKALCEGNVSFYTSPIKALASEKFFSLCDDFGAEQRRHADRRRQHQPGRAGDLLHRRGARQPGAAARATGLDAPYVVMDEFHYYSDRERGVRLAGAAHHPAAAPASC